MLTHVCEPTWSRCCGILAMKAYSHIVCVWLPAVASCLEGMPYLVCVWVLAMASTSESFIFFSLSVEYSCSRRRFIIASLYGRGKQAETIQGRNSHKYTVHTTGQHFHSELSKIIPYSYLSYLTYIKIVSNSQHNNIITELSLVLRYIHTCRQAHMPARTHARMHTYTHKHTLTHSHINTHAQLKCTAWVCNWSEFWNVS